MKVDFSKMDTTAKNLLEPTKTTRQKKQVKSDKRVQIYITAEEEQELISRAEQEHITLKQYILRKTIYA